MISKNDKILTITEWNSKIELERVDFEYYFSLQNKINKFNLTSKIIYRGESYEDFIRKISKDQKNSEEPIPYNTFFIIGSKAKTYFKEKSSSYPSIKHFSSIDHIKLIFTKLKVIEHGGKIHLDGISSAEFEKRIKEISDQDEQRIILNYYLAIVHTQSSDPKEQKMYSNLISCSLRKDVAESFSDDGFVICFWLNTPIETDGINFENLEYYKNLLEKYNLPALTEQIHQNEFEISIFSAIFPNRILYVQNVKENEYIVNPHIFRNKTSTLKKEGFYIDQSDFPNKISGIYDSFIWKSNKLLISEESVP